MIRYAANEDYWEEGLPKVENLVFAITPDASVRYQRLQAGECHVMPYPNPADVAAMKENPDIEVLEQEGLNVGYLAYNTQMEPFDNPRVRQALNMAIDKQAIIDVVFQGSGQIAKNPIPPTMWSYNESRRGRRPRSRAGEGDPRGGGRHRSLDEASGRCRCSGPTTPTRGAWPS